MTPSACSEEAAVLPNQMDWLDAFSEVSDPRREQGTYHGLRSLIGIAILAVLCGADDWEEIHDYGLEKEGWLSQFLALPCGIPSSDTFERVFSAIDPVEFEKGFRSWVARLLDDVSLDVVAIDGKSHRGSYDRSNGLAALHTVSAWSSEHHLVLGEVVVEGKSNEITAIPQLLEMLSLKGAVVTIDAMGAQKSIVKQIREKKADYCVALKANHSNLYKGLHDWLGKTQSNDWQQIEADYVEQVETAHHRDESRKLWAVPVCAFERHPQICEQLSAWQDVATVVVIERRRQTWRSGAVQIQFYLSSVEADAQRLAGIVRSHWSIENQLHWCLDVVFKEDASRIRKGSSARNFGMLRRLALGLLKRETSHKVSLKRKRYKALLNDEYLCSVLAAAS